MRICALIKYPPIQGGVSAQGFWLARGLAEAGHAVEVVTNAFEVEAPFRIALEPEDAGWLEARCPSGGHVRLHRPEPASAKLAHIPQSNPFVSKLAGLATEVVQREGCELIFSYYLEPNGMAAALASAWTGVPYVVQHAGSDLGRLMRQPGLERAYLEVFRRAHGVCSGSPYTFVGMGTPPEALYPHPPFHLPRAIFNPATPALDISAHADKLRQRGGHLLRHPGPLDPALPTIGIYGKMGEVKGSYDLVRALGALRRDGLRFNFVALTSARDMQPFLDALEEQDLGAVTWLLPFLPHWRVPAFLRACDVVCFLERDFPITFHAPSVPREVLSCGTCLVLSGEILRKQPLRERLRSGENFLLVDDPRDHAALARVLRQACSDRATTRAIGLRGAQLLEERPDLSAHVAAYERMFVDVLRRHAGQPTQLSPAEHGLAPTRAAALESLARPALFALGERAEAAVAGHMAAFPDGTGAHADAALLIEGVRASAERDGHAALRDAARYAALTLWQGWLSPGEELKPRFASLDRLPELGPRPFSDDAWLALAPLRGHWVRLERFEHLPDDVTPEPRPRSIVFHKLLSLSGHHFGLNEATAEVLAACDGQHSARALAARFAARTGQPEPQVREVLAGMLRRLHREGLIVFVEPNGG